MCVTRATVRPRIIPARAGFTSTWSTHSAGNPDHPRSRGVYTASSSCARWCWGSSPLARGLRTIVPVKVGGRGIIPARAGFTAAPVPARRAARDHPRSRGVYGVKEVVTFDRDGSSPLARGLPVPGRVEGRGYGIIPARAGFTTPSRRSPRPGGDHPRSRGVYEEAGTRQSSGNGSSPLARGLPLEPLEVIGLVRIIPARAGFTHSRISRTASTADHPRSRGVYDGRPDRGVHLAGSSPLARGLPRRHHPRHRRPRIIPARAGFTTRHRPWTGGAADHPRSRGVYATHLAPRCFETGSSPLARGLPDEIEQDGYRARIIPARAGFTRPHLAQAARRRDHPRSRGVYPLPSLRYWHRAGSSPLARGLLRTKCCFRSSMRIIPARAGFTCGTSRATPNTADHPRSRGVYEFCPGGRPTGLGSSPLARGLLDGGDEHLGEVGIIPARAGFTGRYPGRRRRRPDHPRSRGVYPRPPGPSGRRSGSSPLARGLPRALRAGRRSSRIIPARAGFTGVLIETPDERRDHPRSRGVYGTTTSPARSPTGSSPLARGLPRGRRRPAPRGSDHPRSRGVYRRPAHRRGPGAGSSPLARGLQEADRLPAGHRRIIPARAGFTSQSFLVNGDLRDHPRSRGVYTCGSLVSQRTRSLPDPRRLHCRPRARSAGSP